MLHIDPDIETSVATPCTRVCVVHPVHRLCIGCGRTLDEIAGWLEFDATERARITSQLPIRLAAFCGSAAAVADGPAAKA